MPIKIYTNESVPVAIAAGLQRRGVEALSARDTGNLGLTDRQQLDYARVHQLVVFTHDVDFIRLAHACAIAGERHSGVIYCHQSSLSIGQIIRRLKEISDHFEPGDLEDHIEYL